MGSAASRPPATAAPALQQSPTLTSVSSWRQRAGAAWGGGGGGFQAILDNYKSLEDVQEALRREGLESSNLVVAVDFTKSNEWTGRTSFGGKSLHALSNVINPYQLVITIIARTLSAFDDDNLIPCYGFGDHTTGDRRVFSFKPGDAPCVGLDEVQAAYTAVAGTVRLAGPTSFAPAIHQALKLVVESGNQYHILVLIADGQVTRPSDLPRGQLSPQEHATIQAIVDASNYPLSIIMVGVGDGPWDMMNAFDDQLPARRFDNFQFVNFTDVMGRHWQDPARLETAFALRALMEVPLQYKAIQRLGLLGQARPLPAPVAPPSPCPVRPAPQLSPSVLYSPGTTGAAASAYTSARSSWTGDRNSGGQVPPLYGRTSSNRSAVDGLPAPPEHVFVCPITQEVMTDPVVAADGNTYERAAIEQWLATHDTSPMTNARLPHKSLVPNLALRSSILEHQAAAAAAGAR